MTLGNSLRRVLLSLAPGRRRHLDQDRGRAARVLARSPASARTSPTSSSTSSRSRSRWKARGPSGSTSRATGPAEVTAGMIADHRRHRGHQPRPRDLPPRRRRDAQHGADRRHRQGLCAGGRQPPGRRADRPDPGRRAVHARSARSPTRSRTPASGRSSTTTS